MFSHGKNHSVLQVYLIIVFNYQNKPLDVFVKQLLNLFPPVWFYRFLSVFATRFSTILIIFSNTHQIHSTILYLTNFYNM